MPDTRGRAVRPGPNRRPLRRALLRAGGAAVLALQVSGAPSTLGAPHDGPPTPRQVLGFAPGDDYRLADFRQLRTYFQRLDEGSDRVRLFVAGRSTDGNDMLVAAISSADNLARLDEYREIARRLALARTASDAEARRLAAQGRAVVWIDGGLHASEVATAQHALALAYRVATDESAAMREVRDNVILLLAPCINPDGLNMVADWYRRTLGTPYQDSPMPWLYQRYAGHDDNRDSYMQTQAETQVVSRLLYREWLPQIMYNQHQGTWPPRIFVPPFPDPFNPNIDPEVIRGVDLVGGAMQHRFEREGKDGVISRYAFSIWYDGSVRTTSYFHNIIGILTETGHPSATPFTYDAADFPATLSNGVPTLTPTVTYPHPWRGGTLHLRDAVDYMLTGSLGVLEVAAKYREAFLYGIYQVGARQIHKGQTDPPIAYIVDPERQHDRPAAVEFLATLMKGAIDVHRAAAPFAADGTQYPAGTYVVLLAQPFRPFARDLFEPQKYPDVRASAGGPPVPPYDTAGWTLAYQMGVEAAPVRHPFDASRLARLDAPPVAEGRLDVGPGALDGYVIDPDANNAVRVVNALLARGVRVERSAAAFNPRAGVQLPPGAWLVPAIDAVRTRAVDGAAAPDDAALRAELASLVSAAGVRAWSVARLPPRAREVHAQRIGVYKSWMAPTDEGWTRWVLEQYGFPYASILNDDVRQGRLRDRFDVIVLPDQRPAQILDGYHAGLRPSTPGPWNLPPPEYQGGIGEEGVRALGAFVSAGGTLIALDSASGLILGSFGGAAARITDVTASVPRSRFYCPGSVVRIAVDTDADLGWGMAAESAAYFENSHAFATSDPSVRSIARYAAAPSVLMSGWLVGPETIAGRAALLEFPYGRGRVVLFGFRPQFRAQPHATFKLLFNALY